MNNKLTKHKFAKPPNKKANKKVTFENQVNGKVDWKYYAGGRFESSPPASDLPQPPSEWLKTFS